MISITDVAIGTKIKFVGCKVCVGKHRCFFCKPKVKTSGLVEILHLDFDIPTIEVRVEGSESLLELSEDDLNDPDLILEIF
ncbi:MAG: hypothetical protein CL599_16985 [Alteromonas sp.]|nr:hypothetical protein [Alteromonas sp.]